MYQPLCRVTAGTPEAAIRSSVSLYSDASRAEVVSACVHLLVLERREAANMARFDVLPIEKTLFDDTELVWRGSPGCDRTPPARPLRGRGRVRGSAGELAIAEDVGRPRSRSRLN